MFLKSAAVISNLPTYVPIQLHTCSRGHKNEYVTLNYMTGHNRLGVSELFLSSNMFFPVNFTAKKSSEKLIFGELDVSACKLLIEQE
jgi:hypothetical protein